MDIVLREAARLNQLVTSFLEFARPAPIRLAPCDLAELIGDTLKVFSNDKQAQSLRIERWLESAVVSCDADLLRQVLWNLLLNAAQAMEGKAGERVLRVCCAPYPGGGGWLTVEDTGSGVSESDLPRIFTPFFTTKDRGTGLGLATVHRIIDAHRGTLSVDSAVGRGAVFKVRFLTPVAVVANPSYNR